MVDKANKAKIFAMALEWFTYQSPNLLKTKMTRCSLVYDPHATTEATGVGEPMFNVGEIVADPGAFRCSSPLQDSKPAFTPHPPVQVLCSTLFS